MKSSVRVAPSRQDRRLQIELLRLRADYERLAVMHSACTLLGSLQPAALATSLGDRLGAVGLGWLGSGLQVLRRYPVMLSLLSSFVSNKRRRQIVLKTALIAGLIFIGKRKRS